MGLVCTLGSIATRALSLLLLLCATALAQAQGPRAITFRGAPQAETRGFLITELGLATRLGKNRSHLGVSHATWDVGYMRNVGVRTAVGGALFLSTDDHFNEAYFIGLKPRFRYWLRPRLHADLSAGLVFAELGGGPVLFDYPGVVGHAGIGYGDWGSLILQYEDIRYNYNFISIDPAVHEHNWYLGVDLGSYPGAILGPVVLAAIVIVRNAGFD